MSIHIEPIIMSLIHLDSLSPNLQLDKKNHVSSMNSIEIWDFETYGGHLG